MNQETHPIKISGMILGGPRWSVSGSCGTLWCIASTRGRDKVLLVVNLLRKFMLITNFCQLVIAEGSSCTLPINGVDHDESWNVLKRINLQMRFYL